MIENPLFGPVADVVLFVIGLVVCCAIGAGVGALFGCLLLATGKAGVWLVLLPLSALVFVLLRRF